MADGPILIVEDDDNDLMLIQRSLTRARIGNPLAIARDGVEALQFLMDGPETLNPLPIVVLLDVKLPRIDGLEVLQRIRANERTRTLPVVMLTSSDEQEDLMRGYELGVNSYSRKPIEFAQFQDTVAQVGLYWALINRVPRPE
jgi:two-component system response regulator